MKNRSIKIGLISLIIFVILLVVIVAVTTVAYFGSTKTISGKVNLAAGIRVDFGDDKDATILFDSSDEQFYLLSYDVDNNAELNQNSTKSKLDLSGIRPGENICVVNPQMKSQTPDSYYLRARVKYSDLENVILTSEQMTEIFENETPIDFTSGWLFDNNSDWAYYVGTLTSWTNGDASSADLKLVEENDVVSFFNVNTFNEVDYVSLNIRNNVEYFSVDGVIITLQIQAVEESAVDIGFFS